MLSTDAHSGGSRRVAAALAAALLVPLAGGVGEAGSVTPGSAPHAQEAPEGQVEQEARGVEKIAAPVLEQTEADERFYPDDPIWTDPDTRDVPQPLERPLSEIGMTLQAAFAAPDATPVRAQNVNTLGEVPDSSWFTNRVGRHDLDPEELARGPDGQGPPVPPWTVVGHPGAGMSPKFTIEDANGDQFIIKLDHQDWPELQSATEAIVTRFFHAFGYHVPENHVVEMQPEELWVGEEAEEEGIHVDDLRILLKDAPRGPDGAIRVLASRMLPGKPIGEFRYQGTREDDANDVVPHEHRRELRGMRVFAAWLNRTDATAKNTLDMYVEEDGRYFVRHYVIDFGSDLGSGANGPKSRHAGWEHYWEGVGSFFKGITTLGLTVRPWLGIDYPDYRAIGRFEAERFEPTEWKPFSAIPALTMMDAADAFWAARIVSRLDEDDIRAIVATGRISDPRAEAYLVETLLQRRQKVLRAWLTATSPLDGFAVEGGRLTFDNAAVRAGVARPDRRYDVRWWRLDNRTGERDEIAGAAAELEEAEVALPDDPWGPADEHGLRYAVAEISTDNPGFPHWERPVVVTLRANGETAEVVGVRRPTEMPAEAGTTDGEAVPTDRR